MNIQGQLFRVLNIVKTQSGIWDKKIEDKPSVMDYYYAAYYGGAYSIAKILIKIYNGEIGDSQIDYLINELDNPKNEERYGKEN